MPTPRNRACRAWTVAALALLVGLAAGAGGRPPANAGESPYAGSDWCANCHQIQYKGWVKTFHSTVVQDVKKNPLAIQADMSDPDLPFKKDDIYFAIGGHWDQRYITKIEDDYYILPRLWSVQSKKWRPYSTYGWQKRPYSKYCVGCHSVGFDPKTKTYAEHAVGCESCHGPGVEHARQPGKGNIVNPKRLPEDRSDEVCAACHVRGKDPSGEYYFPIGFRPGEELSRYLSPLEKNEGESDRDAIHRLWDKWKADREAQSRSRCEVCGIHQNVRPQGQKADPNAVCMSCHEYDARQFSAHTRHKSPESVGCSDCHRQKDPELNEKKNVNVHSYGFFLIHPQGCWDPEIHLRCRNCHADKPKDWAYDTVFGWRKPVVLDH